MNETKKLCMWDYIAGIILFLGIFIPKALENPYVLHHNIDTQYFYLAQYILTCLFLYGFIVYVAMRLRRAFGKKE